MSDLDPESKKKIIKITIIEKSNFSINCFSTNSFVDDFFRDIRRQVKVQGVPKLHFVLEDKSEIPQASIEARVQNNHTNVEVVSARAG